MGRALRYSKMSTWISDRTTGQIIEFVAHITCWMMIIRRVAPIISNVRRPIGNVPINTGDDVVYTMSLFFILFDRHQMANFRTIGIIIMIYRIAIHVYHKNAQRCGLYLILTANDVPTIYFRPNYNPGTTIGNMGQMNAIRSN